MGTRRNRAVSNDYDDKFSSSYEESFFTDGIVSPETERRYMREAFNGNKSNLSSFLDLGEEEEEEEGAPSFTEDQFPSLGGLGRGSGGGSNRYASDEEEDVFEMEDDEGGGGGQHPSQTKDFPSLLDIQTQSGGRHAKKKQPKHTAQPSGLTNRKRLPTKKARKLTNSFTSTQQMLHSVPKASLPTEPSSPTPSSGNTAISHPQEASLPTPPPSTSRQVSSSSTSSREVENVSDDELEEGGEIYEIVEAHRRRIEAGEGKPLINILIAGHVDAGKSTLMGHLLVKLGIVEQRTLHRHQREAKEAGKGSFFLAWVLDEDSSEREAGVTMDVGHKAFETEERVVRILDAPGHSNFIPAMIEGASMADAALLVIPSSTNEFEDSFKPKAQTKEHATVLRAMGIKQLVVVVNKMDNAYPPWSYARFLQIREEVMGFLIGIGFKERQVRFVPVSGLTGANLLDRVPEGSTPSSILPPDYGQRQEEEDSYREEGDWSWLWPEAENCPSLVEAINEFRIPPRPSQRPLRCVVSEVISTPSSNPQGNYVLMVHILQGVLREGVSLLSLPRGVLVRPQSILPDDILAHTALGEASGQPSSSSRRQDANRMSYALPGHMVCVIVHADEGDITIGDVLCRGPTMPHLLHDGDSFFAKVFTMDEIFPPLTIGSNLQLHIHGVEVCVRVSELVELITEGSKKKRRKKRLKAVLGGQNALIRIRVEGPLVVESFDQCKRLGSGVLRRRGETVAVCTITENELA